MAVTAPSVSVLRPARRTGSAARFWYRFARNRWAVVALIFIVLQILVGVFARYIAPYDPYFSDYSTVYQAPNAKHLLGSDDLGRDMLSRIIYGTRVSYTVGVVSQVLIVMIGLPLGAVSGLVGGWLDYVLMRVIDVLSSIPGLLLSILLLVVLGPGIGSILVAMTITGWIGIARLVRGQVLSLKETDFVRASRAMGAGTAWIVRAHILRNSLTPVIVSMTLGVPGAMFGEAALSFLGLGVPPPTPSWGQMIGIYQGFVRTSPHLILYPSIVLAITMLAWFVLGDGVRDALDPNIRT
jgi:ABC-type dipeptide/oligopeptide/nickel transport system permease subunit